MHDEPQDLKNVFLNITYLSHRTFLQNICYNKDFEKHSKRRRFFFSPHTSLMLRLALWNLCVCTNPGDVTFPPLSQALNDSWFGISIVKAHHLKSIPLRSGGITWRVRANIICKLYEWVSQSFFCQSGGNVVKRLDGLPWQQIHHPWNFHCVH